MVTTTKQKPSPLGTTHDTRHDTHTHTHTHTHTDVHQHGTTAHCTNTTLPHRDHSGGHAVHKGTHAAHAAFNHVKRTQHTVRGCAGLLPLTLCNHGLRGPSSSPCAGPLGGVLLGLRACGSGRGHGCGCGTNGGRDAMGVRMGRRDGGVVMMVRRGLCVRVRMVVVVGHLTRVVVGVGRHGYDTSNTVNPWSWSACVCWVVSPDLAQSNLSQLCVAAKAPKSKQLPARLCVQGLARRQNESSAFRVGCSTLVCGTKCPFYRARDGSFAAQQPPKCGSNMCKTMHKNERYVLLGL